MKTQVQNRRDFIRLGIVGAAAGLAAPYLSFGKELLSVVSNDSPEQFQLQQ
jgi:hypothetical protein